LALTSSSTLSDAINQYKDNLAYWESTTKAKNLYEAILFLLHDEAQSYTIAGRSLSRQNLMDLKDELTPIIKADSAPKTTKVGLLGFGRAN